MNKKTITIIFGIIISLLGLLWFLQGFNLIHIKPILCFADCQPIIGRSLQWQIMGSIAFVIGALIAYKCLRNKSWLGMNKIVVVLVFFIVTLIYCLYRINIFYSNNSSSAINALLNESTPQNNQAPDNISEIQNSFNDASDVVTKYLEAKRNNDINTLKSLLWQADNNQGADSASKLEGNLGVISLSINKVEISEEGTRAAKERYMGSDLAQNYRWTDDFIKENLIAVYAEYAVDYDNTKVPYTEGEITQYFYLLRVDNNSPWYIWEQNYDVKY